MVQRGARAALVAGVLVFALADSVVEGQAATRAAPTATAVEVVDTLGTPPAPPPPEAAPPETFTVTEPALTETVRLPPRTVTLTVAQPAETTTTDDSTDWGWVAFGVLAFGLLVGGLVWWWRGRHQKPTGA